LPELPEVETVRCQLEGSLMGMTFTAVERTEPAMLRDCSAEEIVSDLPADASRRSRGWASSLVRLDADVYLTLHLGMTGQLLVDPGHQSPLPLRLPLCDEHGGVRS